MERRETKSKSERRDIHSLCMPVPTIVLNTTAVDKPNNVTLTHSRSAGDLDVILNDADDIQSGACAEGISNISGSTSEVFCEKDLHNIEHYCSPRLPRRSSGLDDNPHQRNSAAFVDALNLGGFSFLDTGCRVGSSVSLNSEYTARSVGLISNDSNSESSQQAYPSGVMDSSFQKHSMLKRYYSSPEKDDELLHYQSNVRRNSKSMGNMQEEDKQNFVSFDFGNDSMDSVSLSENVQNNTEYCDIDNSLAVRTGCSRQGAEDTSESDISEHEQRHFVTSVTGSVAMRDGRIRKWLTEITDPDDNANS
ncbi:uncharacterized protein LOC127845054 [Dreissena polymorpha]|uniref:Uncharacterized protein n=1 Tax=Dreissena polymorpha TaxID=45954 RepID=A0A9D4N2H6_DREPO|nr:uncharacterized protein LOC127845054 [Dreissena polymorpha]XP_052231663.1 uncharacterized protein LOC127845054 [Dreissena polymorpha]XP_052231674.1 uncharacterized protein LOC127845054 [Dreissena polymorpha]KAH3887885.1 hypothetical protein DPMN_011907 [Dreissena polymorpha]